MQGVARAALLVAALVTMGAGPPPEAERFRPGGPGGWLVDEANGCWLWVSGIPARAEDLAARWDGVCPDGPTEGGGRSTVRWAEGGRERSMDYEGLTRRGKNEGRGRLRHSEGGRVSVIEDGQFEDDRFVSGRFELPRQNLVYEGAFRFGHPHGRGRLTLRGEVFEGAWERGCLALPDGRGWIAFTRPAEECEGRAT